MEQKEIAYFNNLLLYNIELPIDITLVSTPSLLHNSLSENLQNTKNIDQKFDQAALKHLKFQISNRNQK